MRACRRGPANLVFTLPHRIVWTVTFVRKSGEERMYMSEQPPTTVYEGFIIEDMTPAAFQAATEMDNSTRQANEDGADLHGLIALLESHNRMLLRALGRVEIEARIGSGKITEA